MFQETRASKGEVPGVGWFVTAGPEKTTVVGMLVGDGRQLSKVKRRRKSPCIVEMRVFFPVQ